MEQAKEMAHSPNETDHTDTKVSAPPAFSCKVIPDTEELPESSKQWTRAKRTKLFLGESGLSYNDRSIPYSSITKATMRIYQSPLFLEYGILTIATDLGTDHFGIKYSDYWKGELPFEVERIKEETPFLLTRKLLILCILVYLFWEIVKH